MAPITALPRATVHLLGSAQVLTTPTSLIKELVDNSLDAKATSIDILISSNTLDKLEVRDNGHGIAQADLDSLGRRGHTSKLRSFEELRFLGGITLGFRGEAIASAVQLGDVSLTTKTDGEAVATKVKLKAIGGTEQQIRTSHPVGTTITVLNFMSKLPVRKKTFEKDAAKTLAKINQLLQGYALARPAVKFSLKVTKGGKGSWSYAPRPNGDVRGAVSQVIGKDAAMQCVEKSLVFPVVRSCTDGPNLNDDDDRSSPEAAAGHEHFTIEAFLPMAKADPLKLGHGQYISIDARPVSHEKGTMKKIVALFKRYIGNSLAETSDKVKNPFIRINIQCPVASYDANVEPAKDDVLFGNEAAVIEAVENLLKDVYGIHILEPIEATRRSMAKKLDEFELLLARKPSTRNTLPRDDPHVEKKKEEVPKFHQPPPSQKQAHPVQQVEPADNESADGNSGRGKRQWEFDVSTDYAEKVEGFEIRGQPSSKGRKPNPGHPEETIEALDVDSTLNPWLIAKMTAPSTRDMRISVQGHEALALTPGRGATLLRPMSQSTCNSRPSGISKGDHNDEAQSPAGTITRRQDPYNGDFEHRQPSLDRVHPPVSKGRELLVDVESRPSHTDYGNSFRSARNVLEMFPPSPPPTLVSKKQRGSRISRGPKSSFVSPLKRLSNQTGSDELLQTQLPATYQSFDMHGVDSPREEKSSDLAWAMDFELRKEAATRQRREEIRAMRSDTSGMVDVVNSTRTSPHKNRYNSAIANLESAVPLTTASGLRTPFKTSLPDGDPRAYLMRRQNTMASHPTLPSAKLKLTRAKSMKLPLERIPLDGELHSLVQSLRVDMNDLRKVTEIMLEDDDSPDCGHQMDGLTNISDDSNVMKRLEMLANAWVGSTEGEDTEILSQCDENVKL